MPCNLDAINYFLEKGILLAPAKAANAGGVAISAVEMSQNSMRYYYTFEEVETKLEQIMTNIFKACTQAAEKYNCAGNYVAGANIAAFEKLAKAMKAQGIV
jgi:glutamate dehydrogenase (NADP+)